MQEACSSHACEVVPENAQVSNTNEILASAPHIRERTKRRRSRPSSKDIGEISPTSVIAVYANLLITEDTLRSQYIEVITRRTQRLVFFWVIIAASLYLTYLNGVNPSRYSVILILQRILLVTSYLSLILFYLTGLYTKAFVVAPRLFTDANKALRACNMHLVKVPPTWKEWLFRFFNPTYSERMGGLVKLLPVSPSFSTPFIEAWEEYREQMWEREEEHQRRKSQRSKPAVRG